MKPGQAMETTRGEDFLKIDAGKGLLDRQKFNLPVVAETQVQESLMGLQSLKMLGLVAVPVRAIALSPLRKLPLAAIDRASSPQKAPKPLQTKHSPHSHP